MIIKDTDTFNEKCDKILHYLLEFDKSEKNVTPLIHLEKLCSELGIVHNDPAIHYLSHEKNYISLDRKTAFCSISSLGIAFISHSSFVKEQLKLETDNKLKWYETENAKQIFDNYPLEKSRAIRNQWIAILALIVSVIAIVLQLIYNKNA